MIKIKSKLEDIINICKKEGDFKNCKDCGCNKHDCLIFLMQIYNKNCKEEKDKLIESDFWFYLT